LPTVHIVTEWSGSGEIEAYLSSQLAFFSALTLLPVKSVPEMTYKVSSWKLSLYALVQQTVTIP